MSYKKVFVFILIVLFLVSNIYAQNKSKLIIKGDYTLKDAEVFLNNESVGYAPITLSNLLAGQYFLQFEKDGFKSKSFFVELKEADSHEITVTLEKTPLQQENIGNPVLKSEDEAKRADNQTEEIKRNIPLGFGCEISSDFNNIPIFFNLFARPIEWLGLYGRVGVCLPLERTASSYEAVLSAKLGTEILFKFGSQNQFNAGTVINYGISTDDFFFPHSETGLECSALFGISAGIFSANFYTGITTANEQGLFVNFSTFWHNSLTLKLKFKIIDIALSGTIYNLSDYLCSINISNRIPNTKNKIDLSGKLFFNTEDNFIFLITTGFFILI